MTPPPTPEHFQLLPDRVLHAALRPDPAEKRTDAEYVAFIRMVRYELCRRRCEVPVRDRYVSV